MFKLYNVSVQVSLPPLSNVALIASTCAHKCPRQTALSTLSCAPPGMRAEMVNVSACPELQKGKTYAPRSGRNINMSKRIFGDVRTGLRSGFGGRKTRRPTGGHTQSLGSGGPRTCKHTRRRRLAPDEPTRVSVRNDHTAVLHTMGCRG